jgi:hypothetical protein
MSALCHKRTHAPQQKSRYSITSSASATRVGGTVKLSASAVLRLTANSNLVGCSTGVSSGLAPRKMLSVISAKRAKSDGKLGPYEMRPPDRTQSRVPYMAGNLVVSAEVT